MTENVEYIQTLIDRERTQEWTKPCLEMVKLRELLDSAGIGWHDGTTHKGNRCIHRTESNAYVVIDAYGEKLERRAFCVRWGLFTEGSDDGLLEVAIWTQERAIGNCDAERAYELCVDAVKMAKDAK